MTKTNRRKNIKTTRHRKTKENKDEQKGRTNKKGNHEEKDK